jgi:hypothetical protein
MSKLAPHTRIKPKAALPTVAERDHWHRLIYMGCLVCGRAATIHHVTAKIVPGRHSRSHKRVVPLCPAHHQIQWGPRESVEALGHEGFYHVHGIDLWEVAEHEWENSSGAMEVF